MSELIREALRRYQQIRESDENPINAELLAALRLVQRDAARTGLNKTTMREIDTEIAAYKSEKGAKDAKRRVR